MVIQLTSILKSTAADWVKLQVEMNMDHQESDFRVKYHLQLPDTLQYVLKDLFICIIKEQCSDKEDSTWRQ